LCLCGFLFFCYIQPDFNIVGDNWRELLLKHTFLHIPRVGKVMERKLWNSGIRTWEDGLRCSPRHLGAAESTIKSYLELSLAALERRDIGFFSELLPASEAWRLWPDLSPDISARVAYLDIETSGMSPAYAYITVIGLFDGRELKYFVQGRNLEDFYEEIGSYDLLVTFNGKCFDVPFLRAFMPGLRLPQAHIDLRYVLRKVGFAGGLKAIERQTGLSRKQDELGLLDGFDAVLLWRLHERGKTEALPTLLRYNAEDIVGLKPLLELACNKIIAKLPLDLPSLPVSRRFIPDIPYSAELIRSIKGGF
jgi:uncharacterized protein